MIKINKSADSDKTVVRKSGHVVIGYISNNGCTSRKLRFQAKTWRKNYPSHTGEKNNTIKMFRGI